MFIAIYKTNTKQRIWNCLYCVNTKQLIWGNDPDLVTPLIFVIFEDLCSSLLRFDAVILHWTLSQGAPKCDCLGVLASFSALLCLSLHRAGQSHLPSPTAGPHTKLLGCSRGADHLFSVFSLIQNSILTVNFHFPWYVHVELIPFRKFLFIFNQRQQIFKIS